LETALWSGIYRPFLLVSQFALLSANLELRNSQSEIQKSVVNDKDFKEALNTVLTYYGTQLQSHAATLLGLVIAIFAALSLRSSSILANATVALIISILLTGAAYTLLRLVVYGGLSRSLLYGNFNVIIAYAEKRKDFDWDSSLPQTRVSFYAHSLFHDKWLATKHLGYVKGEWVLKQNDNPRRATLVTIWIASLTVTALFLFLS
jgi:hypothetical protein